MLRLFIHQAMLPALTMSIPLEKQSDLYSAVSDVVFRATTQLLFGKEFLDRHGWQRLKTNLQTLDDNFDLAVGQQRALSMIDNTLGKAIQIQERNWILTQVSPIPHLFLVSFSRARRYLLSAIQESISKGDFGDMKVGSLK